MDYFKKVENLEDLKKQYKKWALELHPDKGGDAEKFKAMQNEFEMLFMIWGKTHKEEREWRAECSEFYTQNGWKGSNYKSSYSTKDIAERLKMFIRTYLNDFKITVKTDYFSGGSSITVTVREIPEELVLDKNAYAEDFAKNSRGWGWDWEHLNFEERKNKVLNALDANTWFDNQNAYPHDMYKSDGVMYEGLNSYVVETLKEMYETVESYRRSDCDGMIDYFDVNFWSHFDYGAWDKKVKVVPKKRKSVFVSTKVKAEAPKTNGAKVPTSSKIEGVEIVDYSEKAIAIIGDTKPIKELLKALGCRFNAYLKCGAGWIAPKSRKAEIEKALNLA